MKNNGVLSLTMTGTPINMDCTIESFTWGENDGTKDINFTLNLKSIGKLKLKPQKEKKKLQRKLPQQTTQRTAKAVNSTTYTVKKAIV